MVVAMLAILKVGAGYAPLDPSYPESRLNHMIEDMQLPLVLTQSQYLPQFEAYQLPCIDVDSLEEQLEAYSDAPLTEIAITPQNIAYINYTSGSTGKPKGVIIPHSGVVRLVKNNPSLPYCAETVTLQHSTASFDAATMEFWGPLLNGGRLICVPGLGFDMDAILAHVKAYEINTLMLTTGLFDQMANYAEHLGSLQCGQA
jgi:non-ribosomal peptide synthetase component F